MDKSKILKIISLGGFGNVTQNMFVYEHQGNILLVDCGVGFINQPDGEVVQIGPDPAYLLPKKSQIRGIVFTHPHDDHIGFLPHFLKRVDQSLPLFASRLTAALISESLDEEGMKAKVQIIDSGSKLQLGPFNLSFVHVTHSVPDSLQIVIQVGNLTIYHGSDFKFDWTPVMDRPSEVGKMAQWGDRGVTLLLSDCLRSERAGYTLSEAMVEESLEREICNCQGKFFVTTISSNVSRWQQAIKVMLRHGRKIVLVGRSVGKIIDLTAQMGYLQIPRRSLVSARQAQNLPPTSVGYLIAGSFAQLGSALDRVGSGEFKEIKIAPGDKVVFSTDYIPGTEVPTHRLIDRLSRLGAEVSYSEISDDLHVSGHGSAADLALLIALTRPKWLLPIGGEFRHMLQYALLAQRMGYEPKRILLPEGNQVVEISSDGHLNLGERIALHPTPLK